MQEESGSTPGFSAEVCNKTYKMEPFGSFQCLIGNTALNIWRT